MIISLISSSHEKFWGYRYLAETFQDRYYKIPSSDLGFIAYIKPNEKFGFDIALTNGEGFRFDPDVYGDVKIASGIDYKPIKELQTRLFYDYTSSNKNSSLINSKEWEFKVLLDPNYNYFKT